MIFMNKNLFSDTEENSDKSYIALTDKLLLQLEDFIPENKIEAFCELGAPSLLLCE